MVWHPDIPLEYRNQIVTGDARELAKRIPDESIDLIFTDPVYDRIDDYRWLAEMALRVLKPDSACLVWYGIGYLDSILDALRVGGLSYRWQGIWYQSNNMQRADMGYCKYSGFVWMEKGRSKVVHPIQDLRSEPVTVGNGRQDSNHFWAKRSGIIEYYLLGFSVMGAVVFDPFTGGGTVPSVCKMFGRNCIAFEIDLGTADRARQRVANTQPPLFVLEPEQLELPTPYQE